MRSPTAARALLTTALAVLVSAERVESLQVPRDDAPAEARSLAAELGCGGCHAGLPDAAIARTRAPRLGPEGQPLPADFVFAYLADPVRRREDIGRTRMPDFGLDEGERVALALFLGIGTPGAELTAARDRHPFADAALGSRIFGALGCAACHSGIDGASRDVGPDLSREGVRVRPEWLEAFLASPTRIRGDGHPAAAGARMPDFRLDEDEISALTGLLGEQGRRFATLDSTPLTRFQAARTARMLEDRLACLGCHQVGGTGGRIGPPLDGIRDRLQPDFVLEKILDPARATPGSPMPRQPMPEREGRRLARYLLEFGAPAERPGATSLASPAHPAWASIVASGSDPSTALYARHCAACHGPEGRGDGWNAADLPVPPTAHADAALMARRPDDTLFDGIYGGAWVLDGSARMPPFAGLLDAGEIRALVGEIRRLCNCSGPAWSSDGRRSGR